MRCHDTDISDDDVKEVLAPYRQAVLIIHGIGNQSPMSTLRPFVDAILEINPKKEQKTKYYSKPDNLSDTFELRRLTSRNTRPRTDYFELYWQHLMPTATWTRIWAWIKLLLWRKSKDVPPSIRRVFRFTRLIAIGVIIALILSILMWLFPCVVVIPGMSIDPATIPLGIAVLSALLQGVVLNYLGDAAIYLSPEPHNIKARQAVRDAGVAMIERLHDGDAHRVYDRIVVVGHSLGSIIGYDILNYAWTRFNKRCEWRAKKPGYKALKEAEKAAQTLWKTANETGKSDKLQRAREEWVNMTRCLWIEQRKNRFPWLVTDFITLGSPLHHSMLLLAKSEDEFKRKKSQRELPTSPPQLLNKGGFSYPGDCKSENGAQLKRKVLEHSAMFAVMRWTNLFFEPTYFGLKGDPIGGTISDALGPGIIDIPVTTRTRNGWFAHTCYWKPHPRDRHDPDSSISHLISALDIERHSFRVKTKI